MPKLIAHHTRAKRSRLLLAAVIAMLGVAVVAGPAAAAVPDHGATMQCRYKSVADDAYPTYYWGGILRRIEMTPPTMYSINGTRQTVGWRFTVERIRYDLYPQEPVWSATYTSGLQLSVNGATPSTPAQFEPMGVKVNLPALSDPENSSWNDVYYRVTLTRVWYRPGGAVSKVARSVMSRYQNYQDGEYGWTQKGPCPGGHSIFVN
jgi:hypothetical protein